MTAVVTLTPAYGREYKSAKAAIADFEANRDFILADIFDRWDGKPINKEQIPHGKRIVIRYAGLRKAACFTNQ